MSTKEASSKERTTSTSYTPEQKEGLTQALQTYLPTLGQGQPSYGGERVAPWSDFMGNTMSQVKGFLDSFKPGGGMPLFGDMGTALKGILNQTIGAPLQSLEQAAKTFGETRIDPARKQFGEYTAPLIREEFAGPGYWGSARAGAVTKGATDLEDALRAEQSQFLWDTEMTNRALQEARAQRSLAGVPLAMQYGQLPTLEAQNRLAGMRDIFGFGQMEQAQRQAEINADIQRFLEQNRITDPENIQIILSLLGMPYTTSTGTASQSGAGLGYSMLSNLAGGLGTGMGAAMMTPTTGGG